ncbi:MAG: hypothetical protein ACYTGS_21965, partial [Planctomycetota bacterium]
VWRIAGSVHYRSKKAKRDLKAIDGGFLMFWAAAIVGLYILGLWWCYEVVRRFPEDVREILELKEVTRTIVIVFIWLITAPLAIGLVIYGYVLISRLILFVRTL